MTRPGVATAFTNIKLNKAEKYVLNMKYMKYFFLLLRPILKFFSDRFIKVALIFVRAMCGNCYMRFFCVSYFFATIGIRGSDILDIYDKALRSCPRIRSGEGLFHYSSQDKYQTGVGLRIPSVRQRIDLSGRYLKYFEACLKCEDFADCYLPHIPFTADKILDGLFATLSNCERMRNSGMCWKAKREVL